MAKLKRSSLAAFFVFGCLSLAGYARADVAMTENTPGTNNSYYMNTTSSQGVVGSTTPNGAYGFTVAKNGLSVNGPLNFGGVVGVTMTQLNYRRPVLQYNTTNVVNIESGLDGTAGDVIVLYPDGNINTETSTNLTQCDLRRNAVLSGALQSGLRTGSVAINTSYEIYSVEVGTDNVCVADTVTNIPANFGTLNTNFGANKYVYLGVARNGDNGSAGAGLLSFIQAGNMTLFTSTGTGGNQVNATGILLATNGAATSLIYTYAAGIGAAQIPNNISVVLYGAASGGTNMSVQPSGGGASLAKNAAGGGLIAVWTAASIGLKVIPSGSTALDIWLMGFIDGALGVGPNPRF